MNIVKEQGLPDFVMLDEVSEISFLGNMKLRFEQQQIYTYIGEQVVSMNPFQQLPKLYTSDTRKLYHRQYMYEVQPHIYALADDTFRQLVTNKRDQCVIVTGESGAGKTEAAKVFMTYLTDITGEGSTGIKDKLLDSNPILESFGNAKTLRNDNSSRFGKYMEIQFDGAAKPIGGRISQYLLEKSRVVTRADQERSFHIFYFLLTQDKLCQTLKLQPDASKYLYLSSSKCFSIDKQDDKSEFAVVDKALNTLGFNASQKLAVWSVLASILHLGQIEFTEGKHEGVESSQIVNDDAAVLAATLLGINGVSMKRMLTSRSISVGANKRLSTTSVPLEVSKAKSTRDSLAKALYNAVFNLVVDTVNLSMVGPSNITVEIVVGILDIYGFEIFATNSFEQFCINYCNEKLQQLFIKLVLKSEQEEYAKENIEWTNIDYFDNQPIISLIEGKPVGIFSLLNETCLISKTQNPQEFVDKMDLNLNSTHYASFAKELKNKLKDDKKKEVPINRNVFRIEHYAGTVDYCTDLFLAKNQDNLYNDIIDVMNLSTNDIIKLFFAGDPDMTEEQKVAARKKRPPPISTQFVGSVCELCETLEKCQPHYIRCIKSNDDKKAFGYNEERVRHQCRYLNLLETVRVRKAGFCNRQMYDRFLHRYKMVSPLTWPMWKGSSKEGVCAILDQLKISKDEYRLGQTKLFVRNARTLTVLEEARFVNMPKVAVALQKRWKGFLQRKRYGLLVLKLALIAMWRSYLARKDYKFNKAAIVIQAQTKGFVTRKYVKANKARLLKERDDARRLAAAKKIQKFVHNRLNYRYIRSVRQTFSGYNILAAGQYGKNASFPRAITLECQSVRPTLEKMRMLYWGSKFIGSVSREDRVLIKQKVVGLALFKGHRPWLCRRSWLADYCDVPENPYNKLFRTAMQALFQSGGDRQVLFATVVGKINRKGANQEVVLIVTESNIYKFKKSNFKQIKAATPLTHVKGCNLSKATDTFIAVQCCTPYRDFLIDVGVPGAERVSELVVVLHDIFKQQEGSQKLAVNFVDKFVCNLSRDAKSVGTDVTVSYQQKAGIPKCEFKLSGKTATIFYP